MKDCYFTDGQLMNVINYALNRIPLMKPTVELGFGKIDYTYTLVEVLAFEAN